MLYSWQSYYWINNVNCWVVIPVIYGVVTSGNFTLKRKIIESIRYNILLYLFLLLVLVIAVVTFILLKINLKHLFIYGLGFYNSVLYIIYMVCLSYGLCKLPLQHYHKRTFKKHIRIKFKDFEIFHGLYKKEKLEMGKTLNKYIAIREEFVGEYPQHIAQIDNKMSRIKNEGIHSNKINQQSVK